GRRGELREEQVLNDRVRRVPQPVRVNDLLGDLGVQALWGLPRPVLHLRVDAEPHDPSLSRAVTAATPLRVRSLGSSSVVAVRSDCIWCLDQMSNISQALSLMETIPQN